METSITVLIESKRIAARSWVDHRFWLLEEMDRITSEYNKARFNSAIRRADEQIQLLCKEIEGLEKAA